MAVYLALVKWSIPKCVIYKEFKWTTNSCIINEYVCHQLFNITFVFVNLWGKISNIGLFQLLMHKLFCVYCRKTSSFLHIRSFMYLLWIKLHNLVHHWDLKNPFLKILKWASIRASLMQGDSDCFIKTFSATPLLLDLCLKQCRQKKSFPVMIRLLKLSLKVSPTSVQVIIALFCLCFFLQLWFHPASSQRADIL